MTAKPWIKLDNAAKIYPAAKRRNWTALFRMSARLTEPVDPVTLRAALELCAKRFPTFTLRLRRGLFWYYLEHIDGVPEIQRDVANPCVRMDLRENRGFMFRVRYYENTIGVEIYHVLTDGTGGLCFLKTLVAEYVNSLDSYELEESLSWMIKDLGAAIRPVFRLAAPHVIQEVCGFFNPGESDDGYDEDMIKARDLLRQFILNKENV